MINFKSTLIDDFNDTIDLREFENEVDIIRRHSIKRHVEEQLQRKIDSIEVDERLFYVVTSDQQELF